MVRSGVSLGLYNQFLRSYQLKRSELDSPFIFVDPEGGEIRLLTNLVSTDDQSARILAFSAHSGGEIEVLTTDN